MTSASNTDRELVRHLARLARLDLTSDEEARYGREFREIVRYLGQIERIRAEPEPLLTTITGVRHVVREDIMEPSVLREALLRQAPDTVRGLIRVPPIQ